MTASQDKTKHGTRVRYMNNRGDLTQRGTVIQLVSPESYRYAGCDCGIDKDDARHPSVWVKWDNGTKSMVATCHLTIRHDHLAA